jgi:hypothetical protein
MTTKKTAKKSKRPLSLAYCVLQILKYRELHGGRANPLSQQQKREKTKLAAAVAREDKAMHALGLSPWHLSRCRNKWESSYKLPARPLKDGGGK